MPYAAGVFSLVSGNPVVTNTTISSSWANNTLEDIANNGLSLAILKDGSQTISANIPMNSFKFTGLGAGTSSGDSVRYQQVFTTTALTDAATISWDASLAPVATVTLGASRIMGAPSNLKAGGMYGLIVTQDGTGGRVLTWNAVFIGQGSGTMPQPETTAGAVTAFVFYSPDATNLVCVQCNPFIDTNYVVRGGTDATKKLRFEVDGLTTATTRVATMPDYDVNLGQPGIKIISLTRDLTGNSGAVAYTGVGFAPRFVVFIAGNAGSSDARASVGVDDGTNALALYGNAGGTIGAFGMDTNDSIVGNTSEGATSQVGHITTLGSDGFTITWTKTGSPGAGTFTVAALCFR